MATASRFFIFQQSLKHCRGSSDISMTVEKPCAIVARRAGKP
jgi:hypothetical protein